jgi:hypothetical protein
MSHPRSVAHIFPARPTIEGAGVHLKRVFGFHQVPVFDPFLMLDDFHSQNPDDYLPGFPWHPHRGIETVTYVLEGEVEHGDSLGNKGTIRPGQVQWMTAGSGIVHQEMPQGIKDRLWGLQLWVNLPRSHKMMPPRYRDVHADDIPLVEPAKGVAVKIIAGRMPGALGPVRDIVDEIEYLDVSLEPGVRFEHLPKKGQMAFAYVLKGEGAFDRPGKTIVGHENAVLFNEGDELDIKSGDKPLRFILLCGRPLREPVAWQGPIVMNTDEELDLAFREYRDGTFLRHSGDKRPMR